MERRSRVDPVSLNEGLLEMRLRDGIVMTLSDKYRPVLRLVKDYSIFGEAIEEADGQLEIHTIVGTTYERDVIREKIRGIGGDAPADLAAYIRVHNPSHPRRHPGEENEKLRKTAHRYSGNPDKYKVILNDHSDLPADCDNAPRLHDIDPSSHRLPRIRPYDDSTHDPG